MAQRSTLGSLVALGLGAAAAFHVSAPRPEPYTAALGAVHSTPSRPAGHPSSAGLEDRLKQDPAVEGEASATAELENRICSFVSCPTLPQTLSLMAPPRPAEPACRQTGSLPAANPNIQLSQLPSAPEFPTCPEVLVAILPDPVHTQLSLAFDRGIDAIEDAMQDAGWNYANSWLPWPSSPETAADTADLISREEQRRFQAGRERLPGVLLFEPRDPSPGLRKNDPSAPNRRAPLLLLLVADSPTTGVVPAQFRFALREFLRFAPPGKTLRILGPTFTGSGPSFRSLLEAARVAEPRLGPHPLQVASGSVSDWNCPHFLPGLTPRQDSRNDTCQNGKDTFVTFGIDVTWESQQIQAFLLRHTSIQRNEIAELSEDESSFGDLVRPISSPPAQSTRATRARQDVLRLTFPRGISHLRAAYQKNSIWGFGASGTASGMSLSLDFAEPHHATDSVPNFAPTQMPASQEGSMAEVAAALEGRRIRAVLVRATDVLDELFVAQILARSAPNVVVILHNADVLFLRPTDRVYRDMYAVSAFPVFTPDLPVTQPDSPRLFPSSDAQALYSATRYLLGDDLPAYAPPLAPGALSELDPGSRLRPSLTLSAIGHGEFLPIALLNDPGTDPSPGTSITQSRINLPNLPGSSPTLQPAAAEPPCRSQMLFLLLALTLALLHTGKCLDLPLLAHLFPRYSTADPDTRLPRLWLQLAITALSFPVLAILHQAPDLPIRPGLLLPSDLWTLLFLLTLASLSVAAAHILLRLALGDAAPPSAARKLLLLLLLAVVIFAAAWFANALLWRLLPPPRPAVDNLATFFRLRSTHLLGGASPVTPWLLALAGLLVLAYKQLGRLSFSPSMHPYLPDQTPAGLHIPSTAQLRPLNDLLEWPIPSTGQGGMNPLARKLRLFLLLACALALIAVSLHLAPSMLDGSALEILYRTTVFALVTGLLWDLLFAAKLWSLLRTLCLLPLESSPLRRGFNAVHGLSWQLLWLTPQGGYVGYRALMRALNETSHAWLDTEARRSFGQENLREAGDLLWSRYAGADPSATLDAFRRVQIRLALVAQSLIVQLQEAWTRERAPVTAADRPDHQLPPEPPITPALLATTAPSSTTAPTSLLEEWVALLYVHYIRMVLFQIRSRITASAILYLLLVWSVTSYPFLNRHILLVAFSVLLALLAAVTVAIYASVNRDPILSRITDERPGHLDVDFFLRTGSAIAIPLLGLIASQFPEVSNFLFSWIEPSISAVK